MILFLVRRFFAPIRVELAFAAFAELEAALNPFPLTAPTSFNRELVNKTLPGAHILRYKSLSRAQQKIRAAA